MDGGGQGGVEAGGPDAPVQPTRATLLRRTAGATSGGSLRQVGDAELRRGASCELNRGESGDYVRAPTADVTGSDALRTLRNVPGRIHPPE